MKPMDRRRFLASMIGIGAAIVVPFNIQPGIEQPMSISKSFSFAQIDSLTARAWARSWWQKAKTESYFHNFSGNDNLIRVL